MTTPSNNTRPGLLQRNWLVIAILAFGLGILTASLLHIGSRKQSSLLAPAGSEPLQQKSDSTSQKPYETFGNDNTGTNK